MGDDGGLVVVLTMRGYSGTNQEAIKRTEDSIRKNLFLELSQRYNLSDYVVSFTSSEINREPYFGDYTKDRMVTVTIHGVAYHKSVFESIHNKGATGIFTSDSDMLRSGSRVERERQIARSHYWGVD